MSGDLVSPYINTELFSKVPLKPFQMNNDIYINLKGNLKNLVEKKCNEYGYVTKIFKILNHSNGLIESGDFSATAIYDVKYSARICIPIENTKIICKISKMNNVLLIVENGPIMCIIKNTDISKKFTINNKSKIINIKSKKELKINDYLIVNVRGKKFMQGDDRILLLGFLEDTATDSQINKYYEEDLNTNLEENDKVEYDDYEEEEEIESSEEDTNNLEIRKSNYIEI